MASQVHIKLCMAVCINAPEPHLAWQHTLPRLALVSAQGIRLPAELAVHWARAAKDNPVWGPTCSKAILLQQLCHGSAALELVFTVLSDPSVAHATGNSAKYAKACDAKLAIIWLILVQPLLFGAIGIEIDFRVIAGSVITKTVIMLALGGHPWLCFAQMTARSDQASWHENVESQSSSEASSCAFHSHSGGAPVSSRQHLLWSSNGPRAVHAESCFSQGQLSMAALAFKMIYLFAGDLHQ